MVNRLFRSASKISGVALTAMVVAALPVRHYSLNVSARGDLSQNVEATHVNSHVALVPGETSAAITKVGFGITPSARHYWPD